MKFRYPIVIFATRLYSVSRLLTGMILTRKLVDLLSDKSVLRHDRSNLPLFMREEGLLRVASPPGHGPTVNGNVLVDRTLTSPIQVREFWTS